MDVGCPKCQTEYELDDERVGAQGVTVQCAQCSHIFKVKRAVTEAEPRLPPAPPSREWRLRQPSGTVFPCPDLTMLQKWIIEGKVQRHDEISLTGETWKRLGNIPELTSFFQIVDDASKVRALEALQAVATPPPEPPPSSPTLPAKPESPVGRQTLHGPRFAEVVASLKQPPLEIEEASTVPMPVQSSPSQSEPSPEELRAALSTPRKSRKRLAAVLGGVAAPGLALWFVLFSASEGPSPVPQVPPAVMSRDAGLTAVVPVVEKPPVNEVPVLDAGTAEPPDAGSALAAPAPVEVKRSYEDYLVAADRLREGEKPSASLEFYRRAQELRPDLAEPIVGRGLALLDLSKHSQAIAAFTQALKISPRFGPAIMGLAETHRAQGQTAQAIEYYQRYLDVHPNGAEATVARNSIERLTR
jgi:predicted Zn finger-like uncharacterized protein